MRARFGLASLIYGGVRVPVTLVGAETLAWGGLDLTLVGQGENPSCRDRTPCSRTPLFVPAPKLVSGLLGFIRT